MVEANKDVVRRYFDERWNKRNYSIVDELDATGGDPEEHKAWIKSVHDGFSQFEVTLDHMIAEGDRVALHWTVSGVLTRPYDEFGDRPDNVVGSAGDRIAVPGLALLRIADGRVVDDIAYPGKPTLS